MFKRYEILLNTKEMAIEVIENTIEIKTPENYISCTPREVMDSARNITFNDMEKFLTARNESPAEWIKNWYLRAICER